MTVFMLFFVLNTITDSVPVFKYQSLQDTIIVYSSDIIEKKEFTLNTIYYLSDKAADRVNNINDMTGSFYCYLNNDKIWAYAKQIAYYAEYIPYGYHVVRHKNESFLNENNCIHLGYRIPPVMINSNGRIKRRYKKLLMMPYNDSQFINIIKKNYSK